MISDFVKHVESNRGKVSLSVVLIVSLLALTGVFVFTRQNTVNAAALTDLSDTLNQSAPTATSNHTIVFTTPTGVAAGETITVTFDSLFSTSSGLDFNDMDLSGSSAGEQTLANVASGATWGATTSGDIVVQFTSGSGTFAVGETITIEIGDNATAGATGDSWITNPTKVLEAGIADIYTVSIGGTQTDSGDMLIAIVEGVAVSVTIDESLSFSVTSTLNSDCDDKFATLGGPDSTASTVPFGTLTSGNTFFHACQDLSVSTNASSGYALTAQTDTALKSGGGVLINNGTCDGTCTETATDTWGTATNNGFAYSSTGTDSVITATSTYRTFACIGATTTDCLPEGGETAQNVMTNSAPVNNSTLTIEYKLSFPGTQAAGTYSNTVTYIATPTF